MKRRNKNKWHRRIKCNKCKKISTFGGIKLFGFIKIKKWKFPRCVCGLNEKPSMEIKEKEVIFTDENGKETIGSIEKVNSDIGFENCKNLVNPPCDLRKLEKQEKDSQGGICG